MGRIGMLRSIGAFGRRVHRAWTARCCSGIAAAAPYNCAVEGSTKEKPTHVPASADVVIIGGGAIGTSTAYHLAKLGVRNIVLLEGNQLSSGTTHHSAGLLWRLRPSDVEVELNGRTWDLARTDGELERETGISAGWNGNGGLFIASTRERLEEYRRLNTFGKYVGIPSEVLTPREARDVHPLIATDDMVGALYSPLDGTIEPAGLVAAYTKGARLGGATVVENCPVTGIATQAGAVHGVRTPFGFIRTNIIVNCAGVWARKVGALAGVNVPLLTYRHAYVVTKKVPGLEVGHPNIRDHDGSVYLKKQGEALSIGGYEMNPILWENVPDNFAFSLVDLDWDVFSAHLQNHFKRVPSLEKIGLQSTVCGPESFTPDHKPLMGPVPELKGFFLGCGFNSGGIMLSGGCGEQLAHWVRDGHPIHDMFSYDITRFHNSYTNNDRWITERSHESYARNYAIVWPNDEPLAGRGLRKSPLQPVLQAQGAVYGEKLGNERPNYFTADGSKVAVPAYDYYGAYAPSPPKHAENLYAHRLEQDYTFGFPWSHDAVGREHIATRTTAGVFDQQGLGKLVVTGRDAPAAMEWLCTNKIGGKPPGATTYTALCNRFGRTEADLTVSQIEWPGIGPVSSSAKSPMFYVATSSASGQHDLSWMRRVFDTYKFDVSVHDASDDLSVIGLMGRRSRDILRALMPQSAAHTLDDAAFPFSTNRLLEIAGRRVGAIRITYVGELGWELHMARDDAQHVYEAIMHVGGPLGAVNAGYRAINSLSMEKGYRHWHSDLRADDTPLENGLAFVCKLASPIDFLGKEALLKQKAKGLTRRLAYFTIDELVPLWGLETVYRNGETCGFIRRAAFGHSLGKSIGFGYVNRGDNGIADNDYVLKAEYEIESFGRRLPAKVSLQALFDPKNERIKGNY